MRWQGQELGVADAAALPGLEQLNGLVRSVTTPEFADVTFHEVMCKSALNHVPGSSAMPFDWTINPYRGCGHACTYCFARGTHEYLELDSGRDFDSQIIVKINVADVLEKELRRGTWMHDPVALGTNTDPYQRAEGRYRLMPGIISALTQSGTPFSILTKGTLLRRDLPLLRDAAERVNVSLAMSIAVFDDALQKLIEPGTPSATARLETVRAATEAGFRVTVFLMPVLPHLTDSIPALDDALRRIRAAGAVRVVFGALHLRPGAKQWFMQWLRRERPELVPAYLGLYPGASPTAPKAYRTWLSTRVRPLLRVHGLDGSAEDDEPRGSALPGPAARTSPRFVTTSRGREAQSAVRLF
ncbi:MULTISPECIES: Rv2578c family radical SAM protein [unclassified Microbacterium]|uniref:Rv2578c family radical SAM protein n=1 Tax=unclassified Microbacterium TaxID=2609290 RepID=UPI00214C5A5B|nr:MULTISPECIES: Rv2578c family radical SAM protein [unclassified Microbacterium]MCR2808190.1 Rv2578c family radical SAM protein [Microbacterium sp. zg.B185]WIM19348.1 Rv2578c family radical SAM protein [Microbacterium sp. zg-B185]